MTATRLALAGVLAATTMLTALSAEARTLRWARSGDALTLDPHAQNEGPTHALNHHLFLWVDVRQDVAWSTVSHLEQNAQKKEYGQKKKEPVSG